MIRMNKIIIAAPVLFISVISAQFSLSQTKPIAKIIERKAGDDSLINMGEIGADSTIMDAAGKTKVSMTCFISEEKHRITLYIVNDNPTNRNCTAVCNYMSNVSDEGALTCQNTVSGGYIGVFCSDYRSNREFKITGGAFDCTQ